MHRWNVLIADDEPMIREGIRGSVDWTMFEMDVKAEAEDGEEALELALEHDIDLLLVDLNMPIMNGLDVIRSLREKNSDCQVIIITGHDEFAYAQEALRMNVTDYILKPVKPEQLQQVVSSVKEKLELKKEEAISLERMTAQVKKNEPILKETFGQEWIRGGMKEEDILSHLAFFELPLTMPAEIGVIQSQAYQAGKPVLSEEDRRRVVFAVKNVVEDWLSGTEHLLFSVQDHVVLITWTRLSEKLIREIEETLKRYIKIHSRFYVEKTREEAVTTLASLYERCRERAQMDDAASPIVRRAKEYVEEHYESPALSLESTAEAVQISPVYLSRMIKQELGVSFVQLVTGKRMKKAIHLLKTTDLSILEIAEMAGYESQHYFSTAFKKSVGMSPNQYRKHFFSLDQT